MEKKFWQSTNFWVNVAMLVLGGFIGFSQAMAEDIIGAVFGVFAAFTSIRNFLKDASFDFKKWVTDSNFWNYLAAVAIAIFPMIPGSLFAALEDVLINAINGNWQAAIIAGITLVNIIYKLVKPTIIKTLQSE